MTKKKLLLKIISFTVAVILVLLIFSIGNSFLGNPVSASIAQKRIQSYVDQNFSTLNLNVEKARYNFKFNNYWARVNSKTSIDTYFTIEYKNGKVIDNTFVSDVLQKNNTARRFEEIYTQEVDFILKRSEIESLIDSNAKVLIEHEKQNEYEENLDKFKIDMPFNKSVPINYYLVVNCKMKNQSPENIATTIKQLHSEYVKNNCIFNKYTFYIENEKFISIDVTKEEIESDKLTEIINNILNEKN